MVRLFLLSHVAASGGSIFSKFFTKYTNSILLSEINPYGWVNAKKVPHFSLKGYRPGRPLDLALNFTSQDLPRKLKIKHFCHQLEICLEYAEMLNKNLVIRDHTHHTFPFHGQENKLSTLDLVFDHMSGNTLFGIPCQISKPILSVRHPLDSFLSSRLRNWHLNYAQNGSFSGYCEAILKLQLHCQEKWKSLVFRYEDLCVNEPFFYTQLRDQLNIGEIDIPECDEVAVTGRSGRSSDGTLQLRERQSKYFDNETLKDCSEDNNYHKLCQINRYESDPFSDKILLV